MAYQDKEKERLATRERVRRYRERKKQGQGVTSVSETITPAIKTVTPKPVMNDKHPVSDGEPRYSKDIPVSDID